MIQFILKAPINLKVSVRKLDLEVLLIQSEDKRIRFRKLLIDLKLFRVYTKISKSQRTRKKRLVLR